MAKMTAVINRDRSQVPSLVTITKSGKTIEVKFDPKRGFELEGPLALLPSIPEILKLIYPVHSIISVRGLEWFDRNPKTILLGYLQNLAPHAGADRWTYKVPPDRIAFIELMSVEIERITAAAPAGFAMGRVMLTTPDVAGSTPLLYAILKSNNNVNAKDKKNIGHSVTLREGDILTAQTSDDSTGGTVDYLLLCKATEFDA